MKKTVAVNLLNFKGTQIAGVEVYFKRLFNALLIDSRAKEFEFHFFVQKGFNAFQVLELPPNAIIEEVLVGNRFFRILYEQLVFPFVTRSYDFVYSPTPAVPFWKLRKEQVVIGTIHDLTPLFFPKKYSYFQRIYFVLISRICAIISQRIVVVSQSTSNDVQRFFKVPASKIDIVYNLIPEVPSEEPELNNTISGELEKPYILFLSTIQPGKNIEGAIRAFALLKKEDCYRDLKLYLAGKVGWNAGDILALPQKLGISDSVIFTGYVDDEVKWQLLRKASAFLYCSFYEGFGIPPVEALQVGKKPIVSNVSSLPEVIGNLGIYVDPNDISSIAEGMRAGLLNGKASLSDIEKQLFPFRANQVVDAFFVCINRCINEEKK